jgi:hypothetical protein
MQELPARVTVYQFPAGYAGTVATLRLMSEVLREEYGHPRMRARARELFVGLESLDVWGEVQAVFDFALEHIRYMRDPIGFEHITRPVALDEQIDRGTAAEDCESVSLYCATLLAAAGIPSDWEIQGTDAGQPKKFKHCALTVTNPRTKETRSFDVIGSIEFPGQFELGDSLHVDGEPIEHFGSFDGERMAGLMGYLDDALLGDSGSGFGMDLFGTSSAPSSSHSTSSSSSGGPMSTTSGMFGTINPLLNMTTGLIENVASMPVFGPTGKVVASVFKVGDAVYNTMTGALVGKVTVNPGIIAAVGGGLLYLLTGGF